MCRTQLTFDDVDRDRVRLGLCGGAGVVAGVGLGDLGHEQPRRPPPALGHHAYAAPGWNEEGDIQNSTR